MNEKYTIIGMIAVLIFHVVEFFGCLIIGVFIFVGVNLSEVDPATRLILALLLALVMAEWALSKLLPEASSDED